MNKELVKKIQEFLGLKADGIYGIKTRTAVMDYQRVHNLVVDGIAGKATLQSMGILDTDLTTRMGFFANGVFVNTYHLPKSEYIEQSNNKNEYLFLHHNAGWNNPYSAIDCWAKDGNGKIATEFVIGGINIKNNDNKYDGVVVQAFPEGGQGWHLGTTGSPYMNKHSVGIELCNFGYIENNRTYTGQLCPVNDICELEEEFRGYKTYHKYTELQLRSLKKLIEYVGRRDNIDIRKGLVEWIDKEGAKAFEFHADAYNGKVKGLLSHSNVRKDKWDVSPQPELIDMLKTL